MLLIKPRDKSVRIVKHVRPKLDPLSIVRLALGQLVV